MNQTFTGRVGQVAGGDIYNLAPKGPDATELRRRRADLLERYHQAARQMWFNPYAGIVLLILICGVAALYDLVMGHAIPWLSQNVILGAGLALVVSQWLLQRLRARLAAERLELVRLIQSIDSELVLLQ